MPTIDALYDAILTLADERPNYVYRSSKHVGYHPEPGSCYYVHRDEWGNPIKGEGCIIGQAFLSLGVEIPEFEEGQGAGMVARGYTNATSVQAERLVWVQNRQDSGVPWGKAVEAIRVIVEARA